MSWMRAGWFASSWFSRWFGRDASTTAPDVRLADRSGVALSVRARSLQSLRVTHTGGPVYALRPHMAPALAVTDRSGRLAALWPVADRREVRAVDVSAPALHLTARMTAALRTTDTALPALSFRARSSQALTITDASAPVYSLTW